MSYEIGPKFQMKQAKNLQEHSGATSMWCRQLVKFQTSVIQRRNF